MKPRHLDLYSRAWSKEDLSKPGEPCYRWSPIHEEASPRLVRATESPARSILTVRCWCGKRVGEVMHTSESLLMLVYTKRPDPFILQFNKAQGRSVKTPDERVALPFFLDETEGEMVTCPRQHQAFLASSALLESIDHEAAEYFLPDTKLPRRIR
jgi:hypothetical protein